MRFLAQFCGWPWIYMRPILRSLLILRRSFSLNARMEVVATTSSSFELPKLGDMTKLDRSQFNKTVEFPMLRIPTALVGRIIGLKSVKETTIPGRTRLKPIMNSENTQEKLVLFDSAALAKVGEGNVLADIANVGAKFGGDKLHFETLRREFSYEDWDVKSCLRAVLPHELDFSGYAQVGHIAHLNLREDLLPYKFTIAEILLDKISWVRTVVNKLNAINNEFRFFDMELLAGEPEYITTVIEQGIRYRFDFSKVFWNSRLTNVHELIIRQFDSDSVIFDVFAGVGPFVLPAVKLKNARKCFANDLNPSSIEYLRENVKLNKIPNGRIEAFNMDGADFIRTTIPAKMAEFSDSNAAKEKDDTAKPTVFHAVMNLPCLAVEFLQHFHGFLSNRPELRDYFDSNPFLVHCHLFVKAKKERPRAWFKERAVEMVRNRLQLPDLEIKEAYYIRTVSTNKEMFCVAFRLPTDYAFDTAPLPAQPEADVDNNNCNNEKDCLVEEPPFIPAAKREAAISVVNNGATEGEDADLAAKVPKIRKM